MLGALYVIFGYIFLNIFLIIFITAINCRFKWNSWKNPFRTIWRARKVFKKPFWRIYIGPYHGGTYFHFESLKFRRSYYCSSFTVCVSVEKLVK